MATGIVLTSCSDRQKALTQSEINAKVDSLVGVKVQELARQSAEDLDRRMSIEVKAKADSIVQVRTTGAPAPTAAPATTTTTVAPPQPAAEQ